VAHICLTAPLPIGISTPSGVVYEPLGSGAVKPIPRGKNRRLDFQRRSKTLRLFLTKNCTKSVSESLSLVMA